MSNEPILVIGATGKTGSRVAAKLEAKGFSVRHGARRSETPFDWEDQSTWKTILSGVSVAYVTYFPDLAFPAPSKSWRLSRRSPSTAAYSTSCSCPAGGNTSQAWVKK